jgi:membrane-bound lytic murein transglycosylase B
LVTANYRALLAYNNATAYALSVGLLAERIAGRGTVTAAWPADDRPLSRSEKEELQRLLVQHGFDPGPIDGQLGPQTRSGIRAFQKKAGIPADGYGDPALLDRLRKP